MSTDSKYNAGDSRVLSDADGNPIGLTDHAIHRWRQRTPPDKEIGIREAWRRGEAIKHPTVGTLEGHPPADTVRVFRHSDGWSTLFIVVRDGCAEFGRSERVVTTILVTREFEHGPTRAYLESHGPHDLGDER